MEYVEEKFLNFTNLKTFKESFSPEMKDAIQTLKDANKTFKSGKYDDASKKYKDAQKKYESIDKTIRSIDEHKVPWFSAENLTFCIPFVNIVPAIVTWVAGIRAMWHAMSYYPGSFEKACEDSKKQFKTLKENPTLSKGFLLECTYFCIEFCKVQIKACAEAKKNGKKVTAENYIYETLEDCLEGFELPERAELSTSTQLVDTQLLESYIRNFV